jgi:photosystem II stability/assembly factor-like uncharacterized protein
MIKERRTSTLMRALVLLSLLAAAGAGAQPADDNPLLQSLTWRSIGPVGAGGRIVDLAVVGEFPHRIYAAAATGGLWKTSNNGLTWEPIFDNQSTNSIGDVAAVSSAPDTVWVGTGEANVRNSVSWGDGVYKTTDGGRTWSHMGLKDSHHIGRIVIDPRRPDTVYVAAAGRLWGPNKERGLFKTTDGGLTWTPSLFIDQNTGVIDVAMDPHDSNTLYAAAYQRRQTHVGGPPAQTTGPGSGIFKTTDAGRTWRKLTSGLPTRDLGRIGLDISLSNPAVMYAIVQTASTSSGFGGDPDPAAAGGGAAPQGARTFNDGGVFRSDDRGESWTWVNAANNRPEYYSQIRVDPANENHVYTLAQNVSVSDDGGKTFRTLAMNVHVDHHAMWINPQQPQHIVLGNDGGVYFTYDGGKAWDFNNQMTLGQFYAVDVDMRKPYYVYGGVQDYCSWGGPSQTRNSIGITAADWFKVMTGDGFQVRIDPSDDTILYAESQNGGIIRHDRKTGRNTSIRPVPAKGQPAYRFNWETPILISPHDPATLYVGGNFLFKSINRGNAWQVISPELPREKTGTLTVTAESPLRAGVLYAGTDDGAIHVTRDGGATWKNVTANIPGVPGPRWVSRVVASRFDEGTAYLTLDGHRYDDFAPYVFKTTDFGQTWQSLRADLPASGPVRVIREDYKNRNLLFVGTEFAVFATVDGGRSWARLMNGMPTVAIADLVIHPRDGELVAGTHGRSVYIMDITPLQQLSDAVLTSDLHVFTPNPALAVDDRVFSDDQFLAQKRWAAENPPRGVTLAYYMKAPASDVKLMVTDRAGRTVRELTGPGQKGINRLTWDLRATPPRLTRRPQGQGGPGGGGGGGGQGGALQGPLVDPGEYQVAIAAGGRQAKGRVIVEPDPMLALTDADRQTRRRDIERLMEVQIKADTAGAAADSLAEKLDALAKALQAVGSASPAVTTKLDEARKQARAAAAEFGRISTRMNALYREVIGSPFVPTDTQKNELEEKAKDLESAATTFDAFKTQTMPALDKEISGANPFRIPSR